MDSKIEEFASCLAHLRLGHLGQDWVNEVKHKKLFGFENYIYFIFLFFVRFGDPSLQRIKSCPRTTKTMFCPKSMSTEFWKRYQLYFKFTNPMRDNTVLKIQATKIAMDIINSLQNEIPANDSETTQSLNESSRGSPGFWTNLRDRGVRSVPLGVQCRYLKLNINLFSRIKTLVALLFYFIEKGLRLESSSSEREMCFKATNLYFLLLALPGSGAFEIFHAVLFNKALSTFKLAMKLQIGKFSPKKRKAGAKGRGAKKASQKLFSQDQPKAKRRRRLSRASSTSSHHFVRNISSLHLTFSHY